MTNALDVPGGRLIEALAIKLKEMEAIKPADWAPYVKTGRHREKAPSDTDWWHIRVAATLRKVYILGPIGTSRLSAEFGGSADRGSKPNHAVKGSGSISRAVLKQLERAGLVQKQKNQGRIVTSKGRSLVDDTAFEVFQEIASHDQMLAKYGRVRGES